MLLSDDGEGQGHGDEGREDKRKETFRGGKKNCIFDLVAC